MNTIKPIGTVLFLLAAAAIATAQVVNIPDPAFKGCLLDILGKASGEDILASEAQAFTGKILCNSAEIKDATGVGAFANVTELTLNSKKLTALDVRSNTSLKTLNLRNGNLSELDLSNNAGLETLDVRNNSNLASLDLSHNPNLKELNCENNQLTTLTIGGNNSLKKLYCENNQLTDLDVSGNTNLKVLHCGRNLLTKLDISKNTALEELGCNSNKLTKLDLSNNAKLKKLHCASNQLETLDVSGNANLEDLNCSNNQLETLDISGTNLRYVHCNNSNKLTSLYANNCPNLLSLECLYGGKLKTLEVANSTNLEHLRCWDNRLETLDISTNTKLKEVHVRSNKLDVLNVGHLTGLESLRCEKNQLTVLHVANNTKLHTLTCENNQLTELNVANNTKLHTLNCNNNQLTSLDVTSCTKLVGFRCQHNRLKTLDISNKPDLFHVQCHDNELETLDLSGCPSLRSLFCHNNQLETLDVSSSTVMQDLFCENNQLISLVLGKKTRHPLTINCGDNKLTELDLNGSHGLFFLNCYNNQLETLDVSKNTSLQTLNCFDNQLTALDVSKNTKLQVLECQNNQLTALDVSNNPLLINFTCNRNQLTSLNLKNGNNTKITDQNIDFTNNNDLRCIQVDDAAYSNAKWSDKKDPVACFSENGCATPIFTQIPPICKGDVLTLPTVSEDQTPISGTWSPAFDSQQTTVYTFTPDGCENTFRMKVIVNPKPVVTLASGIPVADNNTVCAEEKVILTAGGATTYSWNNGLGNGETQEVSPTVTTVYEVTGTNEEGCTDKQTIEIAVNPKPEVTLASDIPVADNNTVCIGQTVKLTAGGADKYFWTGEGTSGFGAEQIVTPPVGTNVYKVTGTDANGCTSTEEITIVVNPKPTVTLVSDLPVADNNTVCAEEKVILTASGADTYSWDNGLGIGASKPVYPTETTTYKVTGTTNGCTDSKSVTVTVKPKTVPDFVQIDPICAGDDFVLPTTSTNGVKGSWLPAIDNTKTTEYTFTPDAGECATTAAMEVVVIQKTIPTFVQIDPICVGEDFVLPTTSTNGVKGSWLPAFDNTETTEYTFTPDAGVCATTATMEVVVIPKTIPTFVQIDPICAGDDFVLPATSTNGVKGSWLPAIDNMKTTEYTFTPDAGVCATTATMEVVVIPKTIPTFVQIDPICAGDDFVLPTTSTNGVKGSWLPAVDNTETTEYTFTPNTGVCATTAKMTVAINPKTIPAFAQIDPICAGDGFVLPATSTNGVKGSWLPAIDNTKTTEYTFTPDAGVCATTATMEVAVNQETTPTFAQIDPIYAGDNIVLPTTSENGISGTWSPTFDATQTTEYTFTPNIGECATEVKRTVEILPVIAPIEAVDDAYVVIWSRDWTAVGSVLDNDRFDNQPIDPAKVLLKPLTASDPRLVMDPTGTIRIAPSLLPGRYTYRYRICERQQPDNCSSEAVAVIDVRLDGLIVPNAFSPNGDGKNDTFDILGMENFDRVELLVVNSWGEEVYRNSDYRNGWSGRKLADGTYYYAITAHKGRHTERIRGWVLLKR